MCQAVDLASDIQRDKFKAVASKFKLGSSSKPPSQTTNITAPVYLEGVHPPPATDHDSMTEEDHVKPLTKNGRQESVISMAVSMTSGSEAPSTHAGGFLGGRSKRDSSSTNVSGLKKRSSLSSWTTKKKSSRPSTASSIDSTELPEFRSFGASQSNMATSMPVKSSGIGNVYPFSGFRSNETTPTSSRRNSQVGLTLDSSLVSEAMENNPSVPEGREEEDNRYTPAKPRPEQAAYIRRLLNGPNLPQRPMDDPLERLRNGMAAMQVQGGAGDPNAVPEVGVGMAQPTIEGLDTDLMDSMKTFTAVEVLEGDNAFACHKCWRYKTGRGGQKKKRAGAATIREDEEDSSDSESDAPAEAPKRPAVAFTKTDTNIPEIAVTTDDEPQVDENAVADEEIDPTRNASNSLTANRTPRKSVTSSVETGRTSSSASGMSGYQTSSEDSSDDAPVGRLSVVRPPPPQRRKSQHFVLQRAFKRYMIARAPPVLVFHFKRFQQSNKHAATQMYSNGFATLKKIDDFVSFPEKIDLSPFLAPERTDYKVQIGPDGIGRANYESHPPGDKGPDLVPMRYKLYGKSS
jgi:ubiquitin carboxyl-terminal hydrolase 16/45